MLHPMAWGRRRVCVPPASLRAGSPPRAPASDVRPAHRWRRRMNPHPAPPDLLRDALASAPWAPHLPSAAGAFVAAWRADDVASPDEVAAALAGAESAARAACREVSAGDHDRWAAACLALGARRALDRARAHGRAADALAAAFAAAAGAQLRALPTSRKQGVAGRSLKLAREAVAQAHRDDVGLRGVFERALAEAAAEALAPLAMALPDGPERARAVLARAEATALARHDREHAFLPPNARRARAAAALAGLAARLADAALAAEGADVARWLTAMTLQLVRAMGELARVFPDDETHDDPARAAPRASPEETPMKTATTPDGTLLQTLQVDATDAAWRAAGSQLVKLTRDPLAAVLCRHLGPDDPALRARVAAFLQTELGAAMVSAVLSAGLTALPLAGPVPERMARELRVRAMAGVGDELADVLMGPLREVASTYLRDAPVADAPARRALDARAPAFGVVDGDVLTAAPRRT